MTLETEIRRIAEEAKQPLPMDQLYDLRPAPVTYMQFALTVCEMVESGQLKRYPAPEHSGSGVKFLYGLGE